MIAGAGHTKTHHNNVVQDNSENKGAYQNKHINNILQFAAPKSIAHCTLKDKLFILSVLLVNVLSV
jgi:hypothetical protein